VLGGSTVALGTGSADFETCFRMFEAAGYTGSFILQAARGEDGDELALAKHNREFASRHLVAARQQGSAIGGRPS
jgi:L-ribulose-5-phosphate 3-epimerase UlaE